MSVEYGKGEKFYGENMWLGDKNSFGRVKAVDSTGRLSGECVGQQRGFKDAYCVSGGSRWGTSTCPRPNDLVSLWWNNQGQAFAKPMAITYGFLKSSGADKLADFGFANIDGGEVHTHSFGHAESYHDNMGNWMAHDGMGDYIHLDARDGEYRLRAIHSKLEELGYKLDGTPAVVLRSGLQEPEFEELTVGTYTPTKSEWHLKVNNKAWIDVSEDALGNLTLQAPNGCKIYMNTAGVTVEGSAIQVTGAQSVNVQSDNITHNSGTEPIVLGNVMTTFMGQLLTAIEAITVPTAMGPSGIPINLPAFESLRNTYLTPTGTPPAPAILSDKSKVAK